MAYKQVGRRPLGIGYDGQILAGNGVDDTRFPGIAAAEKRYGRVRLTAYHSFPWPLLPFYTSSNRWAKSR